MDNVEFREGDFVKVCFNDLGRPFPNIYGRIIEQNGDDFRIRPEMKDYHIVAGRSLLRLITR